jgi:adenylosuccinate lyase
VLVTYLAAGTGLAGIIGAIVSLATFVASRRERGEARLRLEADAGREATDAAFRRTGTVIDRLVAENSRLARRVDELETELTEARRIYGAEMARMREQLNKLTREAP